MHISPNGIANANASHFFTPGSYGGAYSGSDTLSGKKNGSSRFPSGSPSQSGGSSPLRKSSIPAPFRMSSKVSFFSPA